MVELELVGIHTDGEHLVFIGPEGERYRSVIDDALRAAVRRDRPQLEKIRTESAVRPREIQVMIRAGASAEEIAQEFGVPLETIRRYEGPVIAERQHISERARQLPMSREVGAPVLADVVMDRLASRAVESATLEWDAHRSGHEPWVLIARFVAGEREREATWQVDLSAKTLAALDDESRWLTETEWPVSSGPRRHLAAVRGSRSGVFDIDAAEDGVDVTGSLAALDSASFSGHSEPADDHAEDAAPMGDSHQTEALLDQLSATRGLRQPITDPNEELHEPTLWDDIPPAHPPASHPNERADTTVLKAAPDAPDEGAGPRDATSEDHGHPVERTSSAEDEPTRRSRRRRTSVPSWDEIVFGAKND